MLLVYRYRIKSLTGLLNSQARACNVVWNFCNQTQQHALKWNKRWPTGFDLNRLTAGSSKEVALHAGTINAVCEQYAKSAVRRTAVPALARQAFFGVGAAEGRDLKREGEAFRLPGTPSEYSTRGRCRTQDQGRNELLLRHTRVLVLEYCRGGRSSRRAAVCVAVLASTWGLKNSLPCPTRRRSTIRDIWGSWPTNSPPRSGPGNGVKRPTSHARVVNARCDFHHKLSTRIVRQFDYIAVGNVSAAGLAKDSHGEVGS